MQAAMVQDLPGTSRQITADQLEYIRKAIGVTKIRMSLMMGVHYQTYKKWARGENPIDASTSRLAVLLYTLYVTHGEELDFWVDQAARFQENGLRENI